MPVSIALSSCGYAPRAHAQIVPYPKGLVLQVYHTPSVPCASVPSTTPVGVISPGAHAQIVPQPMGPVSQVFSIPWLRSPKCPIPTDFACKSPGCYQRAKPIGDHSMYLCICVFGNKLHGSTPQKRPSKPKQEDTTSLWLGVYILNQSMVSH